MGDKTKIEWTRGDDGTKGATWNPVTGCDAVSEGCTNCYAETIATRFAGTKAYPDGFAVTLRPERLTQPIRWARPRRIFVNSMSDLFHDAVPREYLVEIFAVMAAAERHTFQVLTKRHARMRALLNDDAFIAEVEFAARHHRAGAKNSTPSWGADDEMPWPLPNVWLGVSVETQQWADIRIPALEDTPAAIRFLSCEPLLGPLDLSRWLKPISPMDPATAPPSWADWQWPDWVPARVRTAIESFWSEKWGRGPRAWMADMHDQGAPPFGSVVTMNDGFTARSTQVTGRYVHAWNNIGRIALGGDKFAYTSFNRSEVRAQRPIDWVIAGGESGPNARPMHPHWPRKLREQCDAAGVAYLFKQWGEWRDLPLVGENGAYLRHKEAMVADDGTAYESGDLAFPDGPRYGEAIRAGHHRAHLTVMHRVGKRHAGNELDGRTYDAFPTPTGHRSA